MRAFKHLSWKSWSTPAITVDWAGRSDWTVALYLGPWMFWVSA